VPEKRKKIKINKNTIKNGNTQIKIKNQKGRRGEIESIGQRPLFNPRKNQKSKLLPAKRTEKNNTVQ